MLINVIQSRRGSLLELAFVFALAALWVFAAHHSSVNAQAPRVAKAASDKAKEAAPSAITADEKLSLEWINLQLRLGVIELQITKLLRDQADLKKQAESKMEEIRRAAKVPADYEGIISGNTITFSKPKEADKK